MESIPNHPAMGVSEAGIGLLEEALGVNMGHVLLPSQFYGARGGNKNYEGEKRLMLAILVDGLYCWQRAPGHKGPQLQFEANRWIFEGGRGFFSFERVCEFLDIEPEYLRRGLLEWKAAGRKVAAFHRHGMAGTSRQITLSDFRRDRRADRRLRHRKCKPETTPALRLESPAESTPTQPAPIPKRRDPRNDPDPRDIPGPEVNSDIYDYHRE